MSDISDALLRDILLRTQTIAVVGYSQNPARPSHYVSEFLVNRGYRVVAINPGLDGQTPWGGPIFPDLASIPADMAVDMVDVFRRSDAVPEVVTQALAHLPALRTIWMQIGVRHAGAAAQARAAGCDVVQDQCPKQVYPRLFGDRHLNDLRGGALS